MRRAICFFVYWALFSSRVCQLSCCHILRVQIFKSHFNGNGYILDWVGSEMVMHSVFAIRRSGFLILGQEGGYGIASPSGFKVAITYPKLIDVMATERLWNTPGTSSAINSITDCQRHVSSSPSKYSRLSFPALQR